MELQHAVPLAPFTTLGVGGPAKYFVLALTEDAVTAAFEWAAASGEKVFVLGGGSNIVVSDSGYDGLVIKVELSGVEFADEPDSTLVTAAAGEAWDTLVEACVARRLAGFECLSGIPGTVGGTPVQNVGAYGQEVAETIVSVRCFDRVDRTFITFSNDDCGFEYRKSIFNTFARDRYVVLAVGYRLRKNGKPNLSYKDLKEHFGDRTPTLKEVRNAVLAIRRAKSMVIDPNDPNSQSAGSFFKNPIVPLSVAEGLAEKLELDRIPHFPAGEGLVKIPAAWLIERAGLSKGFALGKAGISQNHSLAIVNRGGATAADILALKNLIQSAVREKFGVELQPEPIFVGF
jgi:UDP-N-acetylmuramate dehydrogenase